MSHPTVCLVCTASTRTCSTWVARAVASRLLICACVSSNPADGALTHVIHRILCTIQAVPATCSSPFATMKLVIGRCQPCLPPMSLYLSSVYWLHKRATRDVKEMLLMIQWIQGTTKKQCTETQPSILPALKQLCVRNKQHQQRQGDHRQRWQPKNPRCKLQEPCTQVLLLRPPQQLHEVIQPLACGENSV